jgi:hypothetical protein
MMMMMITNLHVQAVKSLTSIVGTRRHKERAQQKRKLFFCQNTSRAACCAGAGTSQPASSVAFIKS